MKVLILSLGHLQNDPRIMRQIRALKDEHELTCIGLSSPGLDDVEFIELPDVRGLTKRARLALLLVLQRYETVSHRLPLSLHTLKKDLLQRSYDVIIANDIDTFGFAFDIKQSAKIILDAHEYAPKEFESSWKWRQLFQGYRNHLCRKYLSRADVFITVCQGIADEYAKEFDATPVIMTNASDYRELTPTPVNRDHVRIIHHGVAAPQRQIERMIELMDLVDYRYSLDLMLTVPAGAEPYFEHLRHMAGMRKNVRMVEPVPMKEITDRINGYDIGLYILEPVSFNERYSLPNKFFEFIQARLALAIGPSPEMARVVDHYRLGRIAEDFTKEKMADALNGLAPEEIEFYKDQAHRSARDLSSERNVEKFKSLIESVNPDKVS